MAKPFVWIDYLRMEPMECVDCNLCGEGRGNPKTVEAKRDRYGFDQKADRCLWCGLVYLNPRMTAEAYRQFYESGAYRRLVSAYHGREINERTLHVEQHEYAVSLAAFLAPHVRRVVWHLDVGGSTGVVARYLWDRFAWGLPTIVDPATAETDCAPDIPKIAGTAESFDPKGRTWDLITLCQTIDHLLDPMGVLRKLHGCLSDKGLLFVDAVDYAVTKEIKIDHPYNFTEATMAEMLKRAGLREVARERAPDGVHVRFLCAR